MLALRLWMIIGTTSALVYKVEIPLGVALFTKQVAVVCARFNLVLAVAGAFAFLILVSL